MPGLEVRHDADDSDDSDDSDDDDDDGDEDGDEDDVLPAPSGLTKGTKPRMSVDQANANLSKATRHWQSLQKSETPSLPSSTSARQVLIYYPGP